MQEKTMRLLCEVAREQDYLITAHEGYSGRSMYGKKTCAVEFSDHGQLLVCVAQAVLKLSMDQDSDDPDAWTNYKREVRELTQELRKLRFDQLGLSLIAY